MNWVDTPSAGRSGFVQSRLMIQDVGAMVEIARHGGEFYVEFTRFAPKQVRDEHHMGQEFMSLAAAKAYAVAVLRLS
jgi:hypothetical protein